MPQSSARGHTLPAGERLISLYKRLSIYFLVAIMAAGMGCSRREAELVALLRQQSPMSEVNKLGGCHMKYATMQLPLQLRGQTSIEGQQVVTEALTRDRLLQRFPASQQYIRCGGCAFRANNRRHMYLRLLQAPPQISHCSN